MSALPLTTAFVATRFIGSSPSLHPSSFILHPFFSSRLLCLLAVLFTVSSLSPTRAAEPEPTRLAIDGTAFTLNDQRAFLLGASYYGGLAADDQTLARDLEQLRRRGFNWIRLWATWSAFEHDVSAVDPEGRARQPYLDRLRQLVARCDQLGMVVDVTLSRGNGITGPPRLQTLDAHLQAVRTIVTALAEHRNWYLDLGNERNIQDQRFVSIDDLVQLRRAVKELDPQRLVTASHAGDISQNELKHYLVDAGLDFISPHRPRHADSPGQTREQTRRYLDWMQQLDRVAPVHYQEPFRRGFAPGDWEPAAGDFLRDLEQAVAGGAAGWCFHNGDQKDRPESRPRRSFDLRDGPLIEQLDDQEQQVVARAAALLAPRPSAHESGALRSPFSPPAADRRPPTADHSPATRVSIAAGKWQINEQVTYPGAKAEGLLLNVRMVNAVFEDRNRPDFDPEANTDEFLAALPDYHRHGVLAVTICLQGGMPGYEGAVNSAFNPDGSLRPGYLARVQRVIEACDRQGMAVILGCYYQRQDQIVRDEAAVRNGVQNVVRWIGERGFANVLLEIANEYPHDGFDHRLLKTPEGQAELIKLARDTGPGLLVSTSGIGDGKLDDAVAEASDFLLIHFNGVPVEEIPARIAAVKRFGKPIVCNEDDKLGAQAAAAAEASVAHGASWGLMLLKHNQEFPFTFNGASDDAIVYARLKRLAH